MIPVTTEEESGAEEKRDSGCASGTLTPVNIPATQEFDCTEVEVSESKQLEEKLLKIVLSVKKIIPLLSAIFGEMCPQTSIKSIQKSHSFRKWFVSSA